jgi:cytidylate kinase
MGMEKRLCVICAWRQHCQKRFTVTYDGLLNIHCPDFTRDYTIKDVEADQKLLETQLNKWRKEVKGKAKPCITVSREAGAGGSEVCRKLAEELKMDLIGGHIISRIAESANMSEKVIQSLDEKNVTRLDSFIASFFTARHLWPDVYLQHLIKVIRTAGQHGNAIILGRGAQYILPHNRTFRVRIIGPLEQRVDNVIRNRACSRAEAQAYVVKTDNDRSAFVMKYFHEDIANPALYDLVVNTAGITIDEAVELIKRAYQARRFSEI